MNETGMVRFINMSVEKPSPRDTLKSAEGNNSTELEISQKAEQDEIHTQVMEMVAQAELLM
jgi:hypothetical protein